jgi:hypothetical protein
MTGLAVTCDACWEDACTSAYRRGGTVEDWYRMRHNDAHKRQGLPELRNRAISRPRP